MRLIWGGVAQGPQGCPLSPFLYDVFVDSLLEDIHAECYDDGIPLGGRSLQAGRADICR